MKYYTQNNAYIMQCSPDEFSIEIWDKPKKNISANNITNANYFSNYDEKVNGKKVHFTLPSGSLIGDMKTSEYCINKYLQERGKIVNGKAYYDSSKFNYQNQFYGKEQTTFYIKNGRGNFMDTGGIEDSWSYAIIGVPLIRDGKETAWANCKKQGWGTDVIYATQHILLGMKKNDNDIYVISWKSSTSNMVYSSEAYKKFAPMGFYNLIKLDGGGSAMMRANGKIVQSTAENRQCNGYIVIHQKSNSNSNSGSNSSGNSNSNNSNTNTNTNTSGATQYTSKYPVPTRVLKYGCKGEDVKWLQDNLNHKCNIKTDVDGSYGNGTRTSVITFQKKYGLDSDGFFGPASLSKMKSL